MRIGDGRGIRVHGWGGAAGDADAYRHSGSYTYPNANTHQYAGSCSHTDLDVEPHEYSGSYAHH